MSKKFELKPVAATAGTLLVASAMMVPAVASENPFQITELSSGYMLAEKEGKCGEGKCGEGKTGMKKKGKCHGGMKRMDTDGDGAISKEEYMQHAEKHFSKKDKNNDGQISADEMKMKRMRHREGKCGEGKCGEKKSDS